MLGAISVFTGFMLTASISTASTAGDTQALAQIPTTGWKANPDGGHAPTIEVARTEGDGSAMRLRYHDVPPHWGNSRHALRIPKEATGIAFRMRVNSAAPGAAFHVWLFEKDRDGYILRVRPDGKELVDAGTGWHDVFLPFTEFRFQPRGNRKRAFMTIDHMLFGCNFGDLDVSVADLRLVGKTVRPAPLPRTPQLSFARSDRGAVGILAEPLFKKRPSHSDPKRLAKLLRDAGFGVTLLRAGDVCDPDVLTPAHLDVLVVPCAPYYPSAGRDALVRYLKSGGAFFSIGDYAFDELLTFTDQGWDQTGPTVTAGEMDRARKVSPLINTRFGEPGDTVRFTPEQIGVFDPSFEFDRVAGVRAAPGQFVLPVAWHAPVRPAGFAAVAMVGSDSPVFPYPYARQIPIIEAVDRFGRNRGPVLSVVHNFAGPYAKAGWAFTGVTNLDLFDGRLPALDKAFVAVVDHLCHPMFLHGLTTDFACYENGEPVKISTTIHAGVKRRGELGVRFEVNGRSIGEAGAPKAEDGTVSVSWHPKTFDRDFYPVRCVLLDNGTPIDELQTGFSVQSKKTLRSGPGVRLRKNYFELNRTPTFLAGTNQTGMMWFSAYENPLVWEKDFRRMRDYGLNLLRILHFSPFVRKEHADKWPFNAPELAQTPPKTTQRKTDAIVQTAQKHNVAVFLTLHDWIPVALTDKGLAAERTWDRFWAARYRGVPGMMYDIQNEPGVQVPDRPDIRDLFRGWLEKRYGSQEAAFARWKASGAETTLAPKAPTHGWTDLRARDLDLFRAFLFNRWTAANVAGIREGDPDALATVGFLQNLTAADKPLGIKNVDFANTHYYGALGGFRGTVKLIDSRWAGKSFSVGEFGARDAHDARSHGKIGDPAETSVRWFLAVGHYALGMGAAFVANWDWKEMPDCVFPWGINHADLTPKPVVEAYRNMLLLFRSVQPRYQPPSVYLVLPDGTRFGEGNRAVAGAMLRAVNWLLDTNVGFGVIHEQALDALPQTARALVWPLAYAPSDTTFTRVRQFVESGGRLLVSGDFRFSQNRRPERMDRPGRLGLPGPDFPPVEPFAKQARTVPTGPVTGRLGKGTVQWCPRPVELVNDPTGPATYRGFIDAAGVRRIRVEPAESEVHAFLGDAVEGRYVVLYNDSNQTARVQVHLPDGAPEVRMELGGGCPGFLLLNAEHAVLAAEAQGTVTVGGRPVLTVRGHAAIVALDGQDLRGSRELLCMPFGPASAEVAVARPADKPDAWSVEIGEFLDGRWHALAPAADSASPVVRTDPDSPFDLRVLAAPDRMAHARDQAARLLNRR